MGVCHTVLALVVLAAATPSADATDPLLEPACLDAGVCAGAGMCVLDVGCVPRSCQPLLHCRSEVTLDGQDCEVNLTIDGRTCQTYAGFGYRTSEPGNHGFVGVTLSNGSVDAFNLPNTWVSPALDANLAVADKDPGAVSLGAYRSDIEHEDERWAETGVFVRHLSGPVGGTYLTIGVWTLDSMPEHCYARSSAGDVECPSEDELP